MNKSCFIYLELSLEWTESGNMVDCGVFQDPFIFTVQGRFLSAFWTMSLALKKRPKKTEKMRRSPATGWGQPPCRPLPLCTSPRKRGMDNHTAFSFHPKNKEKRLIYLKKRGCEWVGTSGKTTGPARNRPIRYILHIRYVVGHNYSRTCFSPPSSDVNMSIGI